MSSSIKASPPGQFRNGAFERYDVIVPGWEQITPQWLAPTFSFGNFIDLAVNGNTWIVLKSSGKAARSADNGETWVELTGDAQNKDVVGVDPITGKWMLGGGAGQWAYSDDDGVTWTAGTQGFGLPQTWAQINVMVGYNDVWIIAGQNGRHYRSTDGGANWTLNPFGGDFEGSSDWVTALSTDGTNWALMGYNSGVGQKYLYSTNAGLTWSVASGTLRTFNDMATNGAGTFVGIANSGYASISVDGGASWSELERGLNTGDVNGHFEAVGYGSNGFVAVMRDGYAAKSDETGLIWEGQPFGLGTAMGLTEDWQAVAGNDNRIIAVGYTGYASRYA